MAWTLLAHLIQGSSNNNGFTTSALDTTGADLLWVHLTDGNGTATISDSKSNTWQTDGPKHIGGFSGPYTAQYYVKNPTVGTGHTFTLTVTAQSPSLVVMAWSGSDTTAPLDAQNSAAVSFATTGQAGSITPAANGELLLAGVSHTDTANALSINSSFTISDQITQTNSQHTGSAGAYFVQTTAAAINPTWSIAAGSIVSCSIASFKAAAAAAGMPPGLGPKEHMDVPMTTSAQSAMMR